MTLQERIVSLPDACGVCGEPSGIAVLETEVGRKEIELQCVCQGLTCKFCGKGQTHRPISDYYDASTETLVHVPWFGYLRPCPVCKMESAFTTGDEEWIVVQSSPQDSGAAVQQALASASEKLPCPQCHSTRQPALLKPKAGTADWWDDPSVYVGCADCGCCLVWIS